MTRAVLAELWKRLEPLRAHDDLPTAHLRLVQVIAVAWVCTGQSFVFPAPWLSPLEGVPELPWRLVLAVCSTVTCAGLVSSRFTRSCAAVLALIIALESFAMRTWVAHNRLFALALLVTVALSSKRFSILPRLQVALVFFMAAVDKLTQPAWRDGRFVSSFIEQLGRVGLMWAPGRGAGGANPLAVWLSTHLGDAAAPLGLIVIVCEFTLAFGFAGCVRHAAWLALTFHTGIFVLTGSPMGQFFFAGAASALLLLGEGELPSAAALLVATAVLAGPWTHHLLPLLVIPAVVWSASRNARN